MVADTPAVQPVFALARALLARKLAQIKLLNEWHTEQGLMTEKGYVRRSVRFEADLLKSAEASLRELGLTPGMDRSTVYGNPWRLRGATLAC